LIISEAADIGICNLRWHQHNKLIICKKKQSTGNQWRAGEVGSGRTRLVAVAVPGRGGIALRPSGNCSTKLWRSTAEDMLVGTAKDAIRGAARFRGRRSDSIACKYR